MFAHLLDHTEEISHLLAGCPFIPGQCLVINCTCTHLNDIGNNVHGLNEILEILCA